MKKLNKDVREFGRDYGNESKARKQQRIPDHYYVGNYTLERPTFENICREDSRIRAAYEDNSWRRDF